MMYPAWNFGDLRMLNNQWLFFWDLNSAQHRRQLFALEISCSHGATIFPRTCSGHTRSNLASISVENSSVIPSHPLIFFLGGGGKWTNPAVNLLGFLGWMLIVLHHSRLGSLHPVLEGPVSEPKTWVSPVIGCPAVPSPAKKIYVCKNWIKTRRWGSGDV